MIILNDVNPPLEEVLHSGVKGMRWGVRNKRPTGSQIHGARQRQDQRLRELFRQDDIASTSSGRTKISAEAKAKKVAKDFQTNEDRVTAARMTKGEKAISLILTGPIGATVIGLNSLHVRSVARQTDRLREQVK